MVSGIFFGFISKIFFKQKIADLKPAILIFKILVYATTKSLKEFLAKEPLAFKAIT